MQLRILRSHLTDESSYLRSAPVAERALEGKQQLGLSIVVFGAALERPVILIMESGYKRGSLITLCFIFAVGVVSADHHLTATCIIEPLGFPGMNISGEITLIQSSTGNFVTLKGHLYGFTNGTGNKRGFHVHEYGSIANNCTAAGEHYNPHKQTHGGPNDTVRHVGDLGNIDVDSNLESNISIIDSGISLEGNYSILNKTLVVHEREDDLGKGNFSDSLTTGHSGYRIGCCVITLDPEETNQTTVNQTTYTPTTTVPTGAATSMGPCGFLLLFMAGLLLLIKCIQQ